MQNSKINSSSLDSLSDEYIICICEGAAEEAIINILLKNNCLKFSKENLVGRDITRLRKASEIESSFLHRDYTKPVHILRILDSRREKFNLGKLYRGRYPVDNIYTTPEIEILLIIAEGAYDDYVKKKKTKFKPSTYCEEFLFPKQNLKGKDFIEDYFADVHKLINAIMKYKQKLGEKEYCLADLLQQNN